MNCLVMMFVLFSFVVNNTSVCSSQRRELLKREKKAAEDIKRLKEAGYSEKEIRLIGSGQAGLLTGDKSKKFGVDEAVKFATKPDFKKTDQPANESRLSSIGQAFTAFKERILGKSQSPKKGSDLVKTREERIAVTFKKFSDQHILSYENAKSEKEKLDAAIKFIEFGQVIQKDPEVYNKVLSHLLANITILEVQKHSPEGNKKIDLLYTQKLFLQNPKIALKEVIANSKSELLAQPNEALKKTIAIAEQINKNLKPFTEDPAELSILRHKNAIQLIDKEIEKLQKAGPVDARVKENLDLAKLSLNIKMRPDYVEILLHSEGVKTSKNLSDGVNFYTLMREIAKSPFDNEIVTSRLGRESAAILSSAKNETEKQKNKLLELVNAAKVELKKEKDLNERKELSHAIALARRALQN